MQKILIIDDNSIITRSLKMLLSSSGYEIHEAIGGAEGIRLFNEILPDIVITDMEMPNVSGEEVISSIRKTNSDQIILAMSARENNQKIAMLAGATQFYVKPILHTDIIPYIAY
jgi:DNA-binding response OmpR family regulator